MLFILKSINENPVHLIKFYDRSIEKNDRAWLLGFDDISYFLKYFKKHTGIQVFLRQNSGSRLHGFGSLIKQKPATITVAGFCTRSS